MNERMKLLIAYDGSPCADAALADLARAGLPDEIEAVVIFLVDVWLPPSSKAGERPFPERIPVRYQNGYGQSENWRRYVSWQCKPGHRFKPTSPPGTCAVKLAPTVSLGGSQESLELAAGFRRSRALDRSALGRFIIVVCRKWL